MRPWLLCVLQYFLSCLCLRLSVFKFHFLSVTLFRTGTVIVAFPGNIVLSDFKVDLFKVILLLLIMHVISVVCLLCFRARLFIVALWSPAGKKLASWPSFVMSNCAFVTF